MMPNYGGKIKTIMVTNYGKVKYYFLQNYEHISHKNYSHKKI